jgi:hypothetical protein
VQLSVDPLVERDIGENVPLVEVAVGRAKGLD